MSKLRLDNKKVIVTGGADGIGKAICNVFADEGAKVIVADINQNLGKETVDQINQNNPNASKYIQTDISSESSIQALMEQSLNFLGGLDIVVNNAVAFVFGKVEDVTKEDWEKVFNTNLIGAANLSASALPHLKRSSTPAIVNIASVGGFKASPGFIPYQASKAALIQLTKGLALDLSEYGIRVNCVCPGSIYTSATDRHIKFEGSDKESHLKNVAKSNLIRRIGTPEEVAYAALFLASDEASFITGTQIVVDGGLTIH